MNIQHHYRKKLNFWRVFFIGSMISYVSVNAYLYFILGKSLSLTASLSLLSVKALPILFFSKWILQPNFKASVGFCCLLLFYFTFTAFAMFQEGSRAYAAMVEGLILTALFWSAFKLGKLH